MEKNLGDNGRQTDAAVGRGIRRDIALVHGVPAFEKHGERHARAVKTRAGRAPILARIDVRNDDIASVVYVISEPGRDMVYVFPDDAIVARRRGKTGPARGNGRFADQRFPFEEIGALFADTDHDPRRTGDAVAVPSVGHRRGRGRGAGRPGLRNLGATGQEGQDGKGEGAAS